MKKVFIISIATYMVFMFLVYSGVFRTMANPLDVTKYYFECMQNREGFLTYPICKSNFFNEDRGGIIYSKLEMNLIDKIDLKLLDTANNYSTVQAKIIYINGSVRSLIAELQKSDESWLIVDLK